MNWSALKENRCPKCGAYLEKEMLDINHHCTNDHCDFKISEAKFDHIVTERYQSKRNNTGEDPDQRLSELNNLEL